MADTRAFDVYFGNRTALPGEIAIAGDELLVLRGGTVYRMAGAPLFAYASLDGGVDTTTIATIDVWVPIAGTLIQGVTTSSFSYAANQFTYNGVSQAVPTRLSAKLSMLRVGGGSDSYEVGVFANGILVGTGMTCSAQASIEGFTYTENPHIMETGDIIDMQVRSTTGTADCIITSAQLLIG
jgi:hypothetical protein